MIRLATSELLRAWSRRLVWALVATAAAGIVLGIAIATVNSRPPSAESEAVAERAYRDELARCLDGEYGEVPPDSPDVETWCDEMVRPEMFSVDSGLRLSGLNGLIQGLATLTVVLAIVIAASLVGADWSAGSMATLLTWEPRRFAVFAVRAAVAAVTVFAVSVALLSLFAVLFFIGVSLRGTTIGADGWLGEVAGSILRIGGLAVLFGLFAHALSSLGRSTAAGLGIMLAELVLVEGFLRGFRPSIERWLTLTNAVAVASGEPQFGFANGQPISVGAATLTLVGYALAGLAVAVLVFRARDVT